MSESTMADLHRAVNVAEDGLSETVVDAVRSIRRGLSDPVTREDQAVDRWFSQHHGLPVTIIEAKNGNAWSFEGQSIDASRRGSVKLTSSSGAYVRQRYDELRLIHADPSTLIVDASGVSAAYVIRPGDQITESVVVSMFDSESVSEPERDQTETTDYTADDAKRLLAAGIADDQACGYCNGECASCQQEAAEVIAKIRAEALREAVEVARGQIPAVALGDSDFRQGMISGQIRFAAWLEGRAESEVQS